MPANSTQEQIMNSQIHGGSPPSGGNPESRIRALNDALRRTFVGGRVVLTAGVAALPEATRVAVLAAVRGFEAFTPDNDPYEYVADCAVQAGHAATCLTVSKIGMQAGRLVDEAGTFIETLFKLYPWAWLIQDP